MSLKNEVFEGIAAYKALTPTTQDRYYNEMYDQARRQREKEEKADRDEITAAEARRGGATAEPTPLQPPPIVASTQSQGPIPLPNLPQGTGSFAQALYPDIPPTYRRGGKVANVNVRRYADGGMVAGDNPIDDIIMAQLGPRDPRADLGQYAPRPPPQRPVNPPPPVDPETQARIAAESAPNTRARQGVLPVPPPAAAPPPAVANTGFEGSPVIDPEVEARIAAERQPNQRARAQTQPDLSSAIAAAGGDTAVVTAPPPRAAVRAPAEVVPGAQAAGVLAGQANIPPPPPPGSVSPRGAAQAAQAPVVAPPPPGGPVSPGGEPMPPPTGRTSGLDEALATSGGSEASARAIQPPEQYGPNEPTSSALGRTIRRVIPGFGDEARNRRYKELTDELATLQAGPFTQQTERERAENAPRIAAIQAEIQALRSGAPVPQAAPAPPAPPGDKAPPPPAGAAPVKPGEKTVAQQMFGRGDVGETGGEALVTKAPTPYPTKGVNTVPVKTAPKTNGPPTAGTTGPGGGQGAQAAPPRGAASQPYTQQTAPKGSLGDQTRTAAFDPTADLYDSRNAGRVNQDYTSREASGPPVQLQPNDIKTTLAGVAGQMPNGPRVPGEGAASRPVYQQFVQAHNRGGKLEPGEAALVGMVGRYKLMLRQGKIKEAGLLAMGIMQAASLEAAVRGRYAIDQFKAGDAQGGKQTTIDALSHTPDGRSHKLNPDGSVSTTDPNTGQVINTTQLNPQQWLALAMGLSDGSMIWQSLQSTVAMLNPPDKDASNRALKGQLLEEQIIGARQRNARGRSGGGGKPGPQRNAEVDALLGEYAPKVEAPPQRAGTPDQLSVDYVPGD